MCEKITLNSWTTSTLAHNQTVLQLVMMHGHFRTIYSGAYFTKALITII